MERHSEKTSYFPRDRYVQGRQAESLINLNYLAAANKQQEINNIVDTDSTMKMGFHDNKKGLYSARGIQHSKSAKCDYPYDNGNCL